MTSDPDDGDAGVGGGIPATLTTEEAAVVGVMRRDDRSKEAILNYALSFNG
jgi:hypothetical protein